MESKKSPKADLNKNRSIYFTLGLVAVLVMAYVALEWKSYDKTFDPYIGMNDVDPTIEEDAPIFQLKTLPPPPSVVAPTIIKVAENDDDIIEDIIKIIEIDPNTEIPDVKDIFIEEMPIDEEVDFIRVEEVPIFPGCENAKDKKACFADKMKAHIKRHFRYPKIAQEMGIQGRVSTMFVIQKDGSIGDIKFRGPDPSLEKEALRIINKLPKMKPGKQRDRAVRVPFAQPITFKLQ